MIPEKKAESTVRSFAAAAEGARKSWVPRSPVEIVLEQIAKQERKVSDLEAELNAEKAVLSKLLQAKKVLE